MVSVKEVAEGVIVALEKARVLRTWASVSFARVMLIMSLLGVVLAGTQYAYVNYLLTEAKKNGESRTRQVTALASELGYKATLDAITLCLDSGKEKPKLRAWYCEQAVIQYKHASTLWPQQRVNEVVGRLAYGAMKNDVSHNLRSVELDRLIQSPVSREEEVLKLLLGKTAIALWMFFVVTVMLGAYLALWMLPNRKKGASEA